MAIPEARRLHAVRADTPQQVSDHNRVRTAFLNELQRDERVKSFFAFWAQNTGSTNCSQSSHPPSTERPDGPASRVARRS